MQRRPWPRLSSWVFFCAACGTTTAPGEPPKDVLPVRAGAIVSSADDRGHARFVWARDTASSALGMRTPVEAAFAHLTAHAPAYGLAPSAIAGMDVVRVVDTRRGPIVVTFRRRIDGVDVVGADVGVLLRRDLSLVAIAGTPRAAEEAAASARSAPSMPVDAAVAAAISAGFGAGPVAPSAPARARPVFFAARGALVRAFEVELVGVPAGATGVRGHRIFVAAADGAVLRHENLTAADAFAYRVWVDATGRPLDGPEADYSPNPVGFPDGSVPPFIAPTLVSVEGMNALHDPWLPANAVTSVGNNVDAYIDINPPDGLSAGDFRAGVTSAHTFDRTYDVGADPLASQSQSMASIIQAFYTTNWLHDWFYDSGFDEAAGNAQQDNLGRGGVGGDRMLVEVQDSANTQRDNANMTTPADGSSPRMQIYLWTGRENRTIHVEPLGADLNAGPADFGPQAFDVTGEVRVVDDGTGTTTDGCEAIVNGVAGRIALIDRGVCTFKSKTARAEAAGAVGVIVVDNADAFGPPTMADSGPGTVSIPTLSITRADGMVLKNALQAEALTAALRRVGGITRDGAIDNTIVAHEWGHYLHHRLIGGCGNQQCGAASEGWGDFTALQMVVRAGDDLGGAFELAGYAGGANPFSSYFGIRRAPYSTDFAINPFTFKHIGDASPLPTTAPLDSVGGTNSEVHSAGEIWAEMLFEAYMALQTAPGGRSFDEVRRVMADYVVAGLALTPVDATYTEGRDAVLAAAAAANGQDYALLAQGFARRGAGTCAVSPPRESTDLNGGVESFVVAPRLAIGDVTVDDSVVTCDGDGILDARERGKLRVEVVNTGVAPLSDGHVSVSTTAGITFTGATTLPVPTLAPLASTTLAFDVTAAADVPALAPIDISTSLASDASCEKQVSHDVALRVNLDDVASASADDDVESDRTAWTPTGSRATEIWSRIIDAAPNHVWQGIDFGGVSDTQLESPDLVVGGESLVIHFRHRFGFEASAGMNFDGGVIEISKDGGDWVDVATFVSPGYTGRITTVSGNPLGGRLGYVGDNASFPAFDDVTLDLGAASAHSTIRVRFRIGTDEAAGALGWAIDDLSFAGITNSPFDALEANRATCVAPVADAGPDQTVAAGALVTLDASGSRDANPQDTLTFAWTQTSGPTVALGGASTANPTFTAPDAAATLTFQVSVGDGMFSSTDTVDVQVTAPTADAGVSVTPDAPEPPRQVDAGVGPSDAAEAPTPDAATTPSPDATLPTSADGPPAIDGAPSADALAIDAATGGPDAVAAADARGGSSDAPPTPGASTGCSCSTAADGDAPPLALLLVVLAFARRRETW
jgi:MYXO-CTERM domain-containing protein